MSAIWAFDTIENRHTLRRGEDCIKKSCTSLQEHATNVINFETKKMFPLRKEVLKSYQDTKTYHICGKRIYKSLPMIKIIKKIGIIIILQVNIEAQHIVFVIQNLMCPMKFLQFFITF